MATPPEWVADLVNCVVSQMQPSGLLNPVGCHFHLNEESAQWEISVFVSDTRVIGGEFDGARVQPAFFLNLTEVVSFFDTVENVCWQTNHLGEDDEVGNHISIEGEVVGNGVWLRLLARAPKHVQAGREVSVYNNSVEDLW